METSMITVNMKATGRRIKDLRRRNNLKIRDMVEALGLESEQAIYKWMRGDSMPTIDNLLRLSCLFDCQIDDIVVANHTREEEGESPLLPINKQLYIKLITDLFEFAV